MLSYRHGFHAGNPADVLKHTVLIFCLEYLTRKEKPLLCIDTHAGAGSYPLFSGFAAQNREWEKGLGKLPCTEADRGIPAMLRRYMQVLRAGGLVSGAAGPEAGKAAPQSYPGSPLIMTRLLRPADRLVCFELHPADYRACKSLLGNYAEVRQEDGFKGLEGLLPPRSRRGLFLIDPSYELKEDYKRLNEALARALRRFSTGVYIIWYPLLRKQAAAGFPAWLMGLHTENRCQVELYTAAPDAAPSNSPRGMYGSGLVIYNPPWTLKAALMESLPVLGTLIGTGRDGWKFEELPHSPAQDRRNHSAP
jgi:23S rRNA (adenine2030-N6)-methyltransferase